MTLDPGTSIQFSVDPHELIRVVPVSYSQIGRESIEIWSSNGSGLYRLQNLAIAQDGQSAVAAPDQSVVSIAKVARPVIAKTPITIAIYTSRRSTPKLLDYYQCEIPNGPRALISDGTNERRYTFFPSASFRQIPLSGGRRLRIEARLKYGPTTQLRETFWVSVYVDGLLKRVVSFDTQPESTKRQFVDGCEKLLGRREFAYIDLECGQKRIEIRSSHNAFIRVDSVGLDLCRQRLNQSFELPAASQSVQPSSIWSSSRFDPSESNLGSTFLAPDDGEQIVPDADYALQWNPYLNQQAVQGLARDNRAKHGGLRAYMWMRAMASLHLGSLEYGDEIEVSELAFRIKQRYTRYRTVLPKSFGTEGLHRKVAFDRPSIRATKRSDKPRETIIGAQHIQQSVGAVAQTILVRLTKGSAGLAYEFPDSLQDTVLRLVVDKTRMKNPARVWVQYDDRPPIQLAVSPHSDVPTTCYSPTSLQASLTALATTHAVFDSGTVGGPYAMTREPVALISAGTTQLYKPANVKEVRVTLVAGQMDSIDIGMQFLDGSSSRLSEEAYRHLRTVTSYEDPDSELHAFARRELDNNSVDLESLLKQHHAVFASSIVPNEQVLQPTMIYPDSQLTALDTQANQYLQNGRVPEAIELLTEIIRHSNGINRRFAILKRCDALVDAGDHFLADLELRGWVLHSNDEELKAMALERLLRLGGDNPVKREQLLAVNALEVNGSGRDLSLATQLMNNRRYYSALTALTSLEPTAENQDILLRCSYQLGWWRLFDETVAFLASQKQRELWSGLKSLKFGRIGEASQRFTDAGDLGAEWLRHLKAATTIAMKFKSSSAETRLSALDDWENWQRSHPGPKTWRLAESLVSKSEGTAIVISPSRDLRARYFAVDPGAPAEVLVHGPTRLKFEFRPVHDVQQELPINDWLTFESAGNVKRFPITNNVTSKTTKLEGADDFVPGIRVTTEIEIPPGLQKISVRPDASLVLMRVHARGPEIKTPTLPLVNPNTLAAIIKGTFGRKQHSCGFAALDCVRVVSEQRCESCSLAYHAKTCGCNDLDTAQAHFKNIAYGVAHPWRDRVIPTGFRVDDSSGLGSAFSEIMKLTDLGQPVDLSNQDEKLFQLAALIEFSQQNPELKDARDVLAQVKNEFSWQPYRQYDRRAGVHRLESTGWEPETPSTRLRNAFMNGGASHVLVGDYGTLRLELTEDHPTKFRIAARIPSISFIEFHPTELTVTASGVTEKLSIDKPDQQIAIGLGLPAGQHTIEVTNPEPWPNHFVQLEVQEIMPDGRMRAIGGEAVESSQRPKKRAYHVATFDEPLVFRVSAPNVIRVDQKKGEVIEQQMMPILQDRTISLTPDQGQQQSLFRIFILKPTPPSKRKQQQREQLKPEIIKKDWAAPVVQTMYQDIQGQTVSGQPKLDWLPLLSPDSEPALLQLGDEKTLWQQGMGTWQATLGYRQRLALAESPSASANDRFMELNLSRYLYNESTDRFARTDLMLRPRFDSGLGLGVQHELYRQLHLGGCETGFPSRWGPIELRLQGYLHGQVAAPVTTASANRTPSNLGFRFYASRFHKYSDDWSHRPTLQLFGRSLSESQGGYEPGGIDQDVFTPFKSDHRYGFRLNDRWVYQTSLDKRFWINPSLLTNENELVPDNLGVQFGTDQLLGSFQLRLAYRLTNFFADDDRNNSSLQNVVNLGVGWEKWSHRNRRSTFQFNLKTDLSNGDSSFGINVSSFWNQMRGYRDFRPGANLFRKIREERYAQSFLSDQ